MKKRTMIVMFGFCFVFGMLIVGITAPVSAQSLRIGIGGGAYLPTGDAEESFDISPELHGVVLLGVKDAFELEGGLEYWFLQDALEADDFKASFAVLTGGLRLYVLPTVHLDAGGGVYRSDFEWTANGIQVDDSENKAGAYGGIGFEMGALDLKARAHAPDFDDFYIGASLTYLFDLNKLFTR
jgi:hypothetical protein